MLTLRGEHFYLGRRSLSPLSIQQFAKTELSAPPTLEGLFLAQDSQRVQVGGAA
jgi:hypothetical protein